MTARKLLLACAVLALAYIVAPILIVLIGAGKLGEILRDVTGRTLDHFVPDEWRMP